LFEEAVLRRFLFVLNLIAIASLATIEIAVPAPVRTTTYASRSAPIHATTPSRELLPYAATVPSISTRETVNPTPRTVVSETNRTVAPTDPGDIEMLTTLLEDSTTVQTTPIVSSPLTEPVVHNPDRDRFGR
jgi:hypothetical protein